MVTKYGMSSLLGPLYYSTEELTNLSTTSREVSVAPTLTLALTLALTPTLTLTRCRARHESLGAWWVVAPGETAATLTT